MKLNELQENEGARSQRKRVGRGIGSGKGKTAGRGVKGQKSRSGVSTGGFEGGQMPIYRRLPKRGFSNVMFARKLNIISVGRIEEAVVAERLDKKNIIDLDALVKAGLLRRSRDGVRLLGDGEVKSKLELEVFGASKTAIRKIEKAGGSVNILMAINKETMKEE